MNYGLYSLLDGHQFILNTHKRFALIKNLHFIQIYSNKLEDMLMSKYNSSKSKVIS